MDSPFDHTRYSTILFLDSMVALEGKPLPAMPWHEIDPEGPILLLVVPQVNAEIDKRKRDGRLAKRARDFNRLISTAAETAAPSRIADGPSAVDIAVARCRRIDWDLFGDLEPDDPDHKVVAQIWHARDVPDEHKLLFSHDINPLAAAARIGLGSRKLPEHWLLDPEPGPSEKENQRLRARIRELEAAEPDLQLDLRFGTPAPFRLFRVKPLGEAEQNVVVTHLQQANPPEDHRRSAFNFNPLGHDSEYDDRYRDYRERQIPRYAACVHRFLETQYAQIPFTLVLENKGHVQAEALVLTLTSRGGTLHDRFTFRPLFGPTPPRPQPIWHRPALGLDVRALTSRAGRHDMDFALEPSRGPLIELHCADFRHGRRWAFEGIATIDPHTASPFTIEAQVTASNMRGSRSWRFTVAFEVEETGVSNLIDFAESSFKVPFPMKEHVDAALKAENLDWLDFIDVDGEPTEYGTIKEASSLRQSIASTK